MTAPSTAAWCAWAAWCNRQIDESRVLRVLCREGVAARAWEESILCRLLTGLINLPAWLLHKLYLALRATFDDSVFSRLAFEMGHETCRRPILAHHAIVGDSLLALEQRI